jgi:hypothetical protein
MTKTNLNKTALPEKEKIAEKLRDIVYPRFSTAEFETAHTRAGRRHSIHMLEYALEEERGFPIKATGYVWGGITERKIEWDSRGRAFNRFGMREQDFDLVRKDHKEIEAGQRVSLALLGIILIVLLSAI